MKFNAYLFIAIFLMAARSYSQRADEPNAAAILLELQKCANMGSVLYIAAHPDDENTRLLAYFSKGMKLRTGYLSLTRGDGGQNLIGKEQGDALGLIRTQELLAARHKDGAEQFFTRANDFGFSKNPTETFSIWNKDSILADVVYVIRKFRPDIIICRFPTTGEGGHGQHTASAILATEAYSAAADSTRFKYQLHDGVNVWQPRRLFWNTFNFGELNLTSPTQLHFDAGGYNPLLGESYGEIAAESRSMHKSQGFGTPRTLGEGYEYFKQLKGDSARTTIFDGIDLTWKRFKVFAPLQRQINQCIANFKADAPEKSVPGLCELYKKLLQRNASNYDETFYKAAKLKELQQLILHTSGLWLEATASTPGASPGDTLFLKAEVVNRTGLSIKLNKLLYAEQGIIYSDNTDSTLGLSLKAQTDYVFKHTTRLSPHAGYSDPYWLRLPHASDAFSIPKQTMIGWPELKSPVNTTFQIEVNGLELKETRQVVYKTTDPVKGEIYHPFEVIPPVTVELLQNTIVVTDTLSHEISAMVSANSNNQQGIVHFYVPSGWVLSENNIPYSLKHKGDEVKVHALIRQTSQAISGKVSASLEVSTFNRPQEVKRYTKSLHRIQYDHIPDQFILTDATARLVVFPLRRKDQKIAYIPGAGDEVVPCLRQLGYSVTELTNEQIANSDLSLYGAIVAGVRAYNTNEQLQQHYEKLMQYVAQGGNLIVQYITNTRLGPAPSKIGPYPFVISRDRVTDEKAQVRLLHPDDPLLNSPNKITAHDFEGWVQERGIYFASNYDTHYRTLFSMNDPGEQPKEGSLIVASYGKGNFAYTGLVFFRELPAGVPGAYRLLVNLLSMPRNE